MNCFDTEKARALYEQGLNDRQIAEAVNVSANTVNRWRTANGLMKTAKPGIDEEKARALYAQGMNDPQMAAELGTNRRNVSAWRARNRLGANATRGGSRRMPRGSRTQIDEAAARKLYDRGRSDKEISRVLGVSEHTISQWRQKNGLKSKRERKKADEPFEKRRKKNKCYKCRYGTTIDNVDTACLYILYTGQRRPCAGGEGCTVYAPYKGRQRESVI